jgi:hypothetical protein
MDVVETEVGACTSHTLARWTWATGSTPLPHGERMLAHLSRAQVRHLHDSGVCQYPPQPSKPRTSTMKKYWYSPTVCLTHPLKLPESSRVPHGPPTSIALLKPLYPQPIKGFAVSQRFKLGPFPRSKPPPYRAQSITTRLFTHRVSPSFPVTPVRPSLLMYLLHPSRNLTCPCRLSG